MDSVASHSVLMRYRCAPVIAVLCLALAWQTASAEPWPVEKANAWYQKTPWPVGCNFTPSTAINQLEMWQAATFDPAVIDRELGWAEGLGFTSVRVFLQNLLWQQDKDGFLKRMDQFLALADKHHIKVMFVPLDACWDPFPQLGTQRQPKPGVHNSGWVQSPGVEILSHPERHNELKAYIQGVIGYFKNDQRILAWDLFNEPDNNNTPAYVAHEPTNKPALSLQLIQKTFAWAREMNPSQPLTSGVWIGQWGDPAKYSAMEKFCLEESDIITFHNYGDLDDITQCVKNLRRFNRPILCTEYMARPRKSTFNPILGFLKTENVGAMNWGFVDGKTQTIYPWDSWGKIYTSEPPVWFHDILRKDGTPYDGKETEYIKSVTLKKD